MREQSVLCLERQKRSCIISIARASVHVQPIRCRLTLALGMLNYCNYILTVSLYSFLLQTFTSHSKLSATVPAFVPREAYTEPTFPSNLVINSNLSPLVPEFKPSVSVTSYALPHKPGHHFQYPYHQSYIKQGKFNIKLQQVSQWSKNTSLIDCDMHGGLTFLESREIPLVNDFITQILVSNYIYCNKIVQCIEAFTESNFFFFALPSNVDKSLGYNCFWIVIQ